MEKFVSCEKYPKNDKNVVENEPNEHGIIDKWKFSIEQTSISSLAEHAHKYISQPSKLPHIDNTPNDRKYPIIGCYVGSKRVREVLDVIWNQSL
jgi:hypothetical protein